MEKISKQIFAETDMVIYIFPAEIEHIEMQETHEIYFEIYQRIAKKLDKTPEFIPWLMVTKKFYNPLVKKRMLPFIIPLQNSAGVEFIDYKENIIYENLSVSFGERWLGKTDFRTEFEGIDSLLNQITTKLLVNF